MGPKLLGYPYRGGVVVSWAAIMVTSQRGQERRDGIINGYKLVFFFCFFFTFVGRLLTIGDDPTHDAAEDN